MLALPHGTRFQVLAPVVRGRKGTYEKLFTDFAKQGFARVRVDGTVHELADITGDTPLELARYETHDIDVIVDRLVLRDDLDRRLTESMETALVLGEGVAQIELLPKEADPEILTFSEKLSRPSDGKSFDELAPRNFSFNSPYGYCPACQGLGMTFEVDPELVVPNAELSIAEGAIAPWAGGHAKYFHRLLESTCEQYERRSDVPWEQLSAAEQKLMLYGVNDKDRVEVKFRNRYGRTRSYSAKYEGVIPYISRRHSEAETDSSREAAEGYMREVPCHTCKGARLNPYTLAVTVAGHNIFELCSLPIGEAADVIRTLDLDAREMQIAERVLKEIDTRLKFLSTSGCTTQPAPWRRHCQAARPSGSGSPARSAPGSSECSTSWTSRRSGCTSATTTSSSRRCSTSATSATRWWSSNTTRTPSPSPTMSSTSAPVPVNTAARSSTPATSPASSRAGSRSPAST